MDSYQQLPNQPDLGQTNPANLDQRVQSSYRIKEIERNFERGCINYYGICVRILSAGAGIGLLFSAFFILFAFGMEASMQRYYPMFGPPIFFSWFLYQNFIQTSAINRMDLEKAKKAVKLILCLSGFGLALIALLMAKSEIFDDSYHSVSDLVGILFIGTPSILALIIIVIGSYKVRTLLLERQDLMQKVGIHDGCNSV